MTVKLREVGNSMTVTIPKSFVSQLGLIQGTEFNVGINNGNIVLKPLNIKPKVTIKSLFENYHGDYVPTEYDWGEPVGREIW